MLLKNMFYTRDLAAHIKVREQLLIDLSYNTADSAKYWQLARNKRDGQVRIVQVPSMRLKMIQRRLLPLLEDLYRPNTRAHAYIKGRGLRTNAAPHLGKRFILNTDIVDFFGQINFGRIRGRLRASPYNLEDAIATTIAKLVTCNNKLPLGAPTSPIISNIICSGLDSALSEIAKTHGCFYSRYADDLSFSSNRRSFPRALAERVSDNGTVTTIPGQELSMVVVAQGFQINLKKTRLLAQTDRQEVCGVVCNEKLNTLPKLRRQVRAALHAWRKFGYDEAEKEWKTKYNFRQSNSFEAAIRGKIEFMKYIRGKSDPVVVKYAEQFNNLAINKRPINFVKVKDWKGGLSRSCCCIHSYMLGDTSEMVQGSGFVIDGGYIVTNHHVVMHDNKPFDAIEVTFPSSIKVNIEVEIVAVLPDQDLALLCAKDLMWRDLLKQEICEISNTLITKEDIIWLSGWPNYNEGDDIHLVQGTMVGYSYPNNIQMFKVTPNIVFGNSGGAVFNEAGKVVGIATRGSDLAGAPLNVHNGCVPATWIKDLIECL